MPVIWIRGPVCGILDVLHDNFSLVFVLDMVVDHQSKYISNSTGSFLIQTDLSYPYSPEAWNSLTMQCVSDNLANSRSLFRLLFVFRSVHPFKESLAVIHRQKVSATTDPPISPYS